MLFKDIRYWWTGKIGGRKGSGMGLGLGTLCCSAHIWTNVSSSNKIKETIRAQKWLCACAVGGKLWTRRYKKAQTATSTSEVPGAKAGNLHVTSAHGTTKRASITRAPPLLADPIHSHPHPILGTILHHLGELAGAPVTGFHFLVQQRMSQWSFAWIPRLAPYQFLLVKESKNVGQ